jgi:hypothetical protein
VRGTRCDEISQFVDSRFDQLNTSHNGKLTEQEFEAPATARMAQAAHRKRPDTNRR